MKKNYLNSSKQKFKRMLAFGITLVALLVTSCSDDTMMDSSSTILAETQAKTFKLVEKPSELIRIKATPYNSGDVALKNIDTRKKVLMIIVKGESYAPQVSYIEQRIKKNMMDNGSRMTLSFLIIAYF